MNTKPDLSDLQNWRIDLAVKIGELEMQAKPLLDEISNLNKELVALDQLIKVKGGTSDITATPGSNSVRPLPKPSDGPRLSARRSQAPFTPVDLYWPFVLQSLIDLGGVASSDEVIELVGEKMESIFTPADKERLASGTDLRWRNRVAWQRFNMVRDGLLRADSPRGTWEITTEGRTWLKDLYNRASQRTKTNIDVGGLQGSGENHDPAHQ